MSYLVMFMMGGYYGYIFENIFAGVDKCDTPSKYMFGDICSYPLLTIYSFGGMAVKYMKEHCSNLYVRLLTYLFGFTEIFTTTGDVSSRI